MAAATAHAARHAARARTAPAPRLPRRVSGPVAGHARLAPKPVTGVFERLRALPDHRLIDRLLRRHVWIYFVGVALMGIVAMQVSLLKLNSGISRAVETTTTLERQNSSMEAAIARLASGERIRSAADKRGMVTPAAGAVHYLRVRPGRDASRAVRRMRAPERRREGADGQRRRRARLADGGRRAGDDDARSAGGGADRPPPRLPPSLPHRPSHPRRS